VLYDVFGSPDRCLAFDGIDFVVDFSPRLVAFLIILTVRTGRQESRVVTADYFQIGNIPCNYEVVSACNRLIERTNVFRRGASLGMALDIARSPASAHVRPLRSKVQNGLVFQIADDAAMAVDKIGLH
jgi:hypothetical protein